MKYPSEQQEEQPQQQFTGYWIPVELNRLGLSKTEQLLLSMIHSLEAPAPKYCFASNKFLAEHMDLSESRVSFYITKFKRMGLIKEIGFDGRKRRMACLKENWYKRDFEKELKDSNKELCVKTRSEGKRNHVGGLRENTNHIVKKITKVIPPLSSPHQKPEPIKPKKKPIEQSLRSEEEEINLEKEFSLTALSPNERKRLLKSEHSTEQILSALELSKTQTIRKTLMGLLLNILQNPDKWNAPDSNISPAMQKALKYNLLLSKVNPELAQENENLIKIDRIKVLSLRGLPILQLSIKALDFESDLKQAEKDLLEFK